MKAAAILICPMVQLHSLPDVERDVLRRFFCDHVRGMSPRHDKRWRRFVRDLFNAAPGEGFQIYRAEDRGGPYHRMHRVVLARLFEQQEIFIDVDVLHDWMKLKCWFVRWENGKPVPRSTSFDECSEDAMREFHAKFVERLREPWVQRKFWPHLPAKMRAEMLETVLRDPEEEPNP